MPRPLTQIDAVRRIQSAALGVAAVATMMSGPVVAAAPPGPRAFLEALYRHYPTADTPDGFDPTGGDAPKVFTSALAALIDRDRASAGGEVGALDGDPLCDCQDDGGMTVDIGLVSRIGPESARAVVVLTFTAATPPEIRRLTVKLARTKAGWRIADIESPGETALRARLSHPGRNPDDAP